MPPALRAKTYEHMAIGPRQTPHTTEIAGLMRPRGLPAALRHMRHGLIMDRNHGDVANIPPYPEAPNGFVYVYGGALITNFGHLIGEFIQRLWVLDHLDKKPIVLFALHHKDNRLPPKFAEVLHYLGVERHELITRPAKVPKLCIAQQAKTLGAPGHRDSHIWLAKLAERHKLAGKTAGKLAITRSHMMQRPLIGEDLLEAHLQAEGYRLYRPEQHSLINQLRTLYNAEKIIFADGTACHLLDLLPKIKAEIFFYGPRRKSDLARNSLAPKTDHLTIYEAIESRPALLRLGDKTISANQYLIADLNRLSNKLQSSGFIENTLPPLEQADYQHLLLERLGSPGSDPILQAIAGSWHLKQALQQSLKLLPDIGRIEGKQISESKRRRKKWRKKLRNIGAHLGLF